MQKFVKKYLWPVLTCIGAEFSIATYHFWYNPTVVEPSV
jgi:hypothetical protein